MSSIFMAKPLYKVAPDISDEAKIQNEKLFQSFLYNVMDILMLYSVQPLLSDVCRRGRSTNSRRARFKYFFKNWHHSKLLRWLS